MNLQQEISFLKSIIQARDNEISELKNYIEELTNRFDKMYSRIEELEKTVKEQKQIIDTFKGDRKPPKNSSNSDIPPSKDIYRKNRRRSLREKSGKKPGGQSGHKGHTLEFVKQPDFLINYFPSNCCDCDKALNSKNALLYQSRQVFDIPPPPKPTITQHNIFNIQCSCGCISQSIFPQHIKGHVQYGENICSMVNYLNVRHFLPYDRTVELFKDCFNLKMSKGTIANILRRTAKKALPTYEYIKQQVQNSKVIGSDEAIIFVNAIRQAVWTWQTDKFT